MVEPTSDRAVNLGTSAELLDLLLGGLDLAEAVVFSVSADRRQARTPCPELDVEQLVAHVVAGMRWFAGLPTGRQPGPPGSDDPALTGLPLGPAFGEAARAVRRSWTATEVDGRFAMPWGDSSGQEMAAFMAVEVIGHAWDVAVATGQPQYPVGELAEAALVVAHSLDEQTLRSPGMMADPVVVDSAAPAFDRFAGFLGRDPRWRPLPG